MTDSRNAPRIYVACLAAYNAGTLHGEWIDATQDVEVIRSEIKAMLKASPEPDAEEYAIHDFENFGGLQLHPYEDLDQVAQAAQLITEHGEMAALLIDYYGGPEFLDEAAESLKERFVGSFDNREDWAWHTLEETGALKHVPESLRPYVDLERYTRDMELSGDFIVLEGRREGGERKLYVFWSY